MSELELIVTPESEASVSAPLRRILTTIGSADTAVVRVAGLAAQWAVVQRSEDRVVVRIVGRPGVTKITVGETVRVDGVALGLRRSEACEPDPRSWLGEVVELLASAEDPHEALASVLARLCEQTGAERGAVILREAGSYTVAITSGLDDAGLDPAQLLSDTIIRDVLRSGDAVELADAAATERYRGVPSIEILELCAVSCVPIRVGQQILGALFLGRSSTAGPFSQAHRDTLHLIAAVVAPVLVQLRRAPASRPSSATLVGNSPQMNRLRQLIERVAGSALSVFVHGETGTGKEVVARAIHAASPRRERAMVALNCAAVPESLMASELFGHAKGAFTGAVANRPGLIERADGSTLFLDEVGDMPLAMQASLLRVLERREVVRVGETTPRSVDFRLIAATHKDLEAEVEAGRFRADLLYRLCEITIPIAPLRARRDDLLLLAELFLCKAEAEFGLAPLRLDLEAKAALLGHRWPGNVRELKATIRRAALLADEGKVDAEALGLREREAASTDATLGGLDRSLAQARDEFVAAYVRAVLEAHGGDREAACRALDISERSLYRHLSEKP